MIKPTIGRVIWFYRDKQHLDSGSQPNAGLVAYVHSDTMINVGGVDAQGCAFNATSTRLLQDNETPPESGSFAVWMPYQKVQAAKAEVIEQGGQA